LAGARVIGVDVGGTKTLAAVIDRTGRIERTVRHPTILTSQEALLDALAAAVRELRTADVQAVGFGVPARVDQRTGGALGAVNIPLTDARFRDEMQDRLGLPVSVDNDASMAALAEHRLGAGRDSRDLVLLTLGTGVGGGAILDGALVRGWGELGHMVIVEDGEPCLGACTGRGHVEAYCAGPAVDRVAERVLGPGATSYDLIAQRHPALAEVGRHLGAAIASLVNVFGPEVVVIGGGFGIAAFDQLESPLREVVRRDALPPGGEVRVVPAELGPRAGVIGAGLAALDDLE
jgi:glucokinase